MDYGLYFGLYFVTVATVIPVPVLYVYLQYLWLYDCINVTLVTHNTAPVYWL